MTDAIQELKTRAEILHHRIRTGEPQALARLRALPEFRRSSQRELAAQAATIRRRHCLAVIAAELGFPSWPQAKSMIAGERPATEFGTILCPTRCAVHLNRWYRTYAEAAAARKASAGYLLAYRRQFIVVDRHYITTLGLDPDDADWARLGFDWVRPRSVRARARLYAKLVAALPRETQARI